MRRRGRVLCGGALLRRRPRVVRKHWRELHVLVRYGVRRRRNRLWRWVAHFLLRVCDRWTRWLTCDAQLPLWRHTRVRREASSCEQRISCRCRRVLRRRERLRLSAGKMREQPRKLLVFVFAWFRRRWNDLRWWLVGPFRFRFFLFVLLNNYRYRYKRSLPVQTIATAANVAFRLLLKSYWIVCLFLFFLLWNQTTTSALRMLLTMFRRRTKPRITALHPTAHHRIARVSWTPIRGLSTVSWGGTWIVDVLSRVFKGSCVTQHRAFPAWNIHLQPRLLRHTTILSLPKNYRLAARYRLSYRPTGVSWAYWRTGIFVGRCSHRHAMTGSLHTGVVVDEIMEFRAPSWALLCSRDHCVDIHVEQKAGKNISAKESRTCVHGLR